MATRIGLMGFGRIGRSIFRAAAANDGVEVSGISDIAKPEVLAHLLQFDSILGRYPDKVTFDNGKLTAGTLTAPMLSGRDPGDVNWGELGVDVVVEATDKPRTRAELERHIEAGAKRVIACVPCNDGLDLTVICGVNDGDLGAGHRIISAGNATANAAAPVLKVLCEELGAKQVFLSAIHAYTHDQRVLDVPHPDLRQARAAAENIIPIATGVAEVICAAYPALNGNITTTALKVPVIDGALADITVTLDGPTTADDVNAALRKAVDGPLKGIIDYEDQPIVSKDIVGTAASGVFDSKATMGLSSGLAKTMVWFDSGWGYTNRILELCERLGSLDS